MVAHLRWSQTVRLANVAVYREAVMVSVLATPSDGKGFDVERLDEALGPDRH